MTNKPSTFVAIGLMSGTSLDGLDLVCCRFTKHQKAWKYEVLAWKELSYNAHWQQSLSDAFSMNQTALQELDVAFGTFLGQQTRLFINEFKLQPDLVCSHGHTVFHRPAEKVSLQIGEGQSLANACGLLTINNFRQADVLKGGHGAPLVPIGDRLLFGDFDVCLNIGGIANLSFEQNGQRIAWDIAPANMVLNHLANKLGLPYDKDGNQAASGRVNQKLVEQLDDLQYFKDMHPKSLGREWVEQIYFPLVLASDLEVVDLLATCTHQIAGQIAAATSGFATGKILVTGGGAYNKTLINRLRAISAHEIIIPDEVTIKMKEAIVFALLGVLRFRGEINCLSSVTGAESDSSTGDIYHALDQNS